jgi:hypothetical protein
VEDIIVRSYRTWKKFARLGNLAIVALVGMTAILAAALVARADGGASTQPAVTRGGTSPAGVTQSTPLPGEAPLPGASTTMPTADDQADMENVGADNVQATEDKPVGPTTIVTVHRDGAEGAVEGKDADAALKGFMEKIAKQADDALTQEKAANEAAATGDDAGIKVTKTPNEAREDGAITVVQPGDVEMDAEQNDQAAAEENEMPAQDAAGVYVGEGAEFAHAGRALTGQKIRVECIVTRMSAAAEPNGAAWVDSEDGKFHMRVQWRECPPDLEKYFRTVKRREGQKLSLTGKVRGVTPEQVVMIVEEWSAGD